MFTGLVETIGTIERVEHGAKGARFRFRCNYRDYEPGESIAVSGICLTVTEFDAAGFSAEASKETLDKTVIGQKRVGDRVHLERAMPAYGRLGGHLVSGHVDGVGRLASRAPLGDAVKVTFEVPAQLAPFLAPKGSVTIDGVSLTVNGASGTRFDVVLVPYTRSETLFDTLPEGGAVNIEVDLLAKYVARLMGRPGVDGIKADNPTSELTMGMLQDAGYLDR